MCLSALLGEGRRVCVCVLCVCVRVINGISRAIKRDLYVLKQSRAEQSGKGRGGEVI